MEKTIGGDRLGAGGKQKVTLKTFNRSSHDLSYLWRSSMSAGTLVPFMSEVALPGDSWDIDLNCEIVTLPTVGPLFGRYKVQLDVFQCPIRLYQGQLHMNLLNIGLDMQKIKLPQVKLSHFVESKEEYKDDNSQINPSCIFSYLNIRGLGKHVDRNGVVEVGEVVRNFNAVPYLAYWDIYKQYYSNKMEERGMVIHNDMKNTVIAPVTAGILTNYEGSFVGDLNDPNYTAVDWSVSNQWELDIDLDNPEKFEIINNTLGLINVGGNQYTLDQIWNTVNISTERITCRGYKGTLDSFTSEAWVLNGSVEVKGLQSSDIKLKEFPLTNIDDMKMNILANVKSVYPFQVDEQDIEPYNLSLNKGTIEPYYSKLSSQEGLAIKTYQSDLFNNWISTEWIDGTNGINEVTSVSTQGGSFTIDSLNLANKVYMMLNRIAISGGTYDDWLDAVYTHDRSKSVENPVYMGSLIKELGFQEVIGNAGYTDEEGDQPLGTLAGRGKLTNKHKGGKIKVKVDEPSYIMGIVSLTPLIDYSQGNKWDVNLETMDDFHKPSLDAIGFQDLITDQMSWTDTGVHETATPMFNSAGKQPAWINYMTNVNRVRGTFAEKNKDMFMTLNRRYDTNETGIEDLTTYVDPSKFNHIFADTRLDSQNFWVQISNQITARRKMSAKVIPNL